MISNEPLTIANAITAASEKYDEIFRAGAAHPQETNKQRRQRAMTKAISEYHRTLDQERYSCDHRHYDFKTHGRRCSCGALMTDWGD